MRKLRDNYIAARLNIELTEEDDEITPLRYFIIISKRLAINLGSVNACASSSVYII
jgi:hypothetical protein